MKKIAFLFLLVGFFLGAWIGSIETKKRERTKAIHENAAEYYINPNTYDREFRYKQPVAAPTPLPLLTARIPAWDLQPFQ